MFDAAAFCGGYAVPLVRRADPDFLSLLRGREVQAAPNEALHLAASSLRWDLAAAAGRMRLSVRLLSKLKRRADL